MVLLSFGIGLLLSFQAAAPSPAPDPALLGQWESAIRTQGGVGNILEFKPGGTVTQISAAMGDSTYALEGEWLRTFWKDESTGKINESDTRLEFQGSDVFSEKGEDGSEQSYSERIGRAVPKASPVVGEWCSVLLEMLTNYRQFTPDGKMYIRMPITVLRGRYGVAPGVLDVQIDGQPPGKYPFRFEDGQLVIKNRDGTDRIYKRTGSTLLKGY
jgi:hypothetical protein